MPTTLTSTLYDFVAPSVDIEQYAIFGRILPNPESGVVFLWFAIALLAVVGFANRRIPKTYSKLLLVAGVAMTYIGIYILSARWLDDVFINLIHPYNLLHHGYFSTKMSSMNNGTVEFVYYALLTPFAGDRIGFIRACYAAGAIVGAAHLLVLAKILRSVPLYPRFAALTIFALWIPIIQSFASGYGNGLVTLLWLLAVVAMWRGNTVMLGGLCAILPLIRPDALLYSISLALMHVFLHRRLALSWWLPTLLSPVAYTAATYLMYHQLVPTPIIFKRIEFSQILSAVPESILELLISYILSPERITMILLGVAYFLLPSPGYLPFRKRAVGVWLLSTAPVLFFFYTTGKVGYNPTNYRYYGCFEIALCITGLFGLISLLHQIEQHVTFIIITHKAGKLADREKQAASISINALAFIPAVAVLIQLSYVNRSINSLQGGKDWMGYDIGISSTAYDLRRMDDLHFGGEYFGHAIPKEWAIASTEMNTFGYFSDHEILDLWGFSNMEIAKSEDKMPLSGVRRDPELFLHSNVPVMWIRSMSDRDYFYGVLHSELESKEPANFAKGLWKFPNLSGAMRQAGYLDITLQKYDVVRILHGSNQISLLLVRRDLSEELKTNLIRNGAVLSGKYKLMLNAELVNRIRARALRRH